MTDYIRKAVELADGFGFMPGDPGCFYVQEPWDELSAVIEEPDQWLLDALAAQLVRQVDALDYPVMVIASKDCTSIVEPDQTYMNTAQVDKNEGRTLNTIKAIVDSGVLE